MVAHLQLFLGDNMQTKIKHVGKRKNIAIIAHDGKKDELIKWVSENTEKLKNHNLFGTGTTAGLIKNKFHLDIEEFLSGPMGGDQMMGAKIAQNEIDILIFFWDPLMAQPHDPDVKALLRIAVLYDVTICMSEDNCNYIFSSEMIDKEYDKTIIDSKKMLEGRIKEFE